jgi:DNA polymerase
MIAGEQPGDREDLWLGCRLSVRRAGVERIERGRGSSTGRLATTNAVKHFKHTVRGKRRIHQSPNRSEVTTAGSGSIQKSNACSRKSSSHFGGTAALALTRATRMA